MTTINQDDLLMRFIEACRRQERAWDIGRRIGSERDPTTGKHVDHFSLSVGDDGPPLMFYGSDLNEVLSRALKAMGTR